MKRILSSLILLTSIAVWASPAADANLLNYSTVVDINQYQGQTYFSIMEKVIKPSLDNYATQGFTVKNGNEVRQALRNIDRSVAQKAVQAAGGEDKLANLADQLSAQGKVTFYDLPNILSRLGAGRGRYDLTTFFSLVSGGGVALKINSQNFAYNVNYGTGKTDKDEMTGRSYGQAPGRLALDASDKHYLQSLENFVRNPNENISDFYLSILSTLTNSDTSRVANLSALGQSIATDFIAVYTAEQDRHLMAHLRSHQWDDALLQVTLLSALHSGQRDLMVMYNGELTSQTQQQAPGCNTEERRSKRASLTDYWQFSRSTDPTNCNRSGINVTRKDFQALGKAISEYQRQAHPALVAKVESHFKGIKTGGNLFSELSSYLINFNTPEKLGSEAGALAQDFTNFLMQVRADANTTSNAIIQGGHVTESAQDDNNHN